MKTTIAATMRMPALALAAAALLAPGRARAHCDTLDGPVVADARAALEKGDLTPALKWVMKDGEGEVREAFKRALAVRAKGGEAKDLADTWFFETLVRVHRAGEGAPYTGLKPAGQIEPVVAAADKALATGSVDALAERVGHHAAQSVREKFARVAAAKKKASHSVEAGRDFVAAYVVYVHHVEALHQAASGPAGHGAEHAAGGHAHGAPAGDKHEEAARPQGAHRH